MTDAILFNCCTGNQSPDWKLFSWLEIGGCITIRDDAGNETATEGGIDDAEAEFWTVYGRLQEGGLDAITDCKTRQDADSVAAILHNLSGLSVR